MQCEKINSKIYWYTINNQQTEINILTLAAMAAASTNESGNSVGRLLGDDE
jgi:hypothetical protein